MGYKGHLKRDIVRCNFEYTDNLIEDIQEWMTCALLQTGCNFEYSGDLIRDIHGWMMCALLKGSAGKLNLLHKTCDQSSLIEIFTWGWWWGW